MSVNESVSLLLENKNFCTQNEIFDPYSVTPTSLTNSTQKSTEFSGQLVTFDSPNTRYLWKGLNLYVEFLLLYLRQAEQLPYSACYCQIYNVEHTDLMTLTSTKTNYYEDNPNKNYDNEKTNTKIPIDKDGKKE